MLGRIKTLGKTFTRTNNIKKSSYLSNIKKYEDLELNKDVILLLDSYKYLRINSSNIVNPSLKVDSDMTNNNYIFFYIK